MKSKIIATGLTLALVASYEGLQLVDYYDPYGGIDTACFGHTETADKGKARTVDGCEDLLIADIRKYQAIVLAHAKVDLNDRELAAYTSFVYNVGEGNYQSSTLLRKLNAGDRVGACNELPRWVYSGGVKLNGLVKRRAEERDLCLSGL